MKLVERLTLHCEEVGPSDMQELRALGVPDESIEGVVAVCAAFNTINRIADALEFAIPSDASFEKSAPTMYKRGYSFG